MSEFSSHSSFVLDAIKRVSGKNTLPEIEEFMSVPKNAKAVDAVIGSVYYNKISFIRLSTKYGCVLKGLKASTHVLFIALALMMNQDNMFSVSYQGLEEWLDLSRPSITKSICELEKLGFMIYMPSDSAAKKSTFFINPKIVSCCKIERQSALEKKFIVDILALPATKKLPSGKMRLENFYKLFADEKNRMSKTFIQEAVHRKDGIHINTLELQKDAIPVETNKKDGATNTAEPKPTNTDTEDIIPHSKQENQQSKSFYDDIDDIFEDIFMDDIFTNDEIEMFNNWESSK